MERLTGLDASFLYFETPRMHMHVAMVAILDPAEMPGGYSFEKIQDFIESRVPLLPIFTRRLLRVPFDLHHPVWVHDPDFDVIHHVRRVACPAPGGVEELGAIVGRILSTPLDRSRPLWEIWVIEGLERGRFVVLCKVHHSAVDGVTGAGILVHLFSPLREGAPVPAPSAEATTPIPTDGDLLKHAVASRLAQPLGFFKLARRTAQVVGDVIKLRKAPLKGHGAVPLTAPRTHFNAAISARRNVAFARVSLEPLKEVRRAFDTTLNDVVLAVCAGALRRYFVLRGDLPRDPLIATCPISVAAPPGEPGSNHVSAMFTSLATDIEDPVDRLMKIREGTRGAKEEHSALGAHLLQDWAELAAPATFHAAARFYTRMRLADKHRPIHNLVISNVPGPPFSLYLAGARVESAYPMGPVLEGAALNITVLSYSGSVDFGIAVAADAMPDVWDLARAIEPAADELVAAARREAGNTTAARMS